MGDISDRERLQILREAQAGNLETFKVLLKSKKSFNMTDLRYEKTGDTILHVLAREHPNQLSYIISSSLNKTGCTTSAAIIDCRNNDDKTPLHEAAQFSNPLCTQILIQNGASVNALKRADWTPLMLACTKSCPKTVPLLLENGALVNLKNKDGWTALHLICRQGSIEIFQILMEFGADFEALTRNRRSALHIAALHGSTKIVSALLHLGLDANSKDSCGNTPLMEAVLGRNIAICEVLIQAGADLECRNNADFGLLHLASSEGYTDLIKFLVNQLNFEVDKCVNSGGLSPLHCAARKKQTGSVELLVELGGDSRLKDKFGRTPLDYLGP